MLLVLSSNWWALALRGLLAILFGVVVLLAPGLTLMALLYTFGAFALLSGILSIIAGILGKVENRWWAIIVEGALGVIAGLIAFFMPGVTAMALLILIAAWALVIGIAEIVAAIRLRKEIRNEWLLGLGGAISVIFGIVLFLFPGRGILAMLLVLGVYAIIHGIVNIVLSFRLRRYLRGVAAGRVITTPEG